MDDSRKKIYLDYAATTPVDKGVLQKMESYFSEKYGNPASIHIFGQEAQAAVDGARNKVAQFLRCSPEEIIFTSGATESNNLALKGVIKAFYLSRAKSGDLSKTESSGKPHIIVSRIEHHCVLDSCKSLEDDGLAEVTYIPVNQDGLVELNEIEKALKENTILVSIMYANNEVGVIQPIAEIGELLKNRPKKILFHTDAVQAINYLDCDVQGLGVDLLSLSGHKIYGPKGIGASYIKKGTPIVKIQDGGSQEFNLRAGTLNIPGIVGLGAAIENIKNQEPDAKNIQGLRDKLVSNILEKIPHAFLNGSMEKRLPNNANIRFEGAEGEAILMGLDLEGIAVSTASACAARSLKPSHVLTAMGLSGFDAHSSVRFSLGKYTTEEEIDRVLEVLPGVVERLRKIGGEISKKQERLPDDFGC